MLKSHYHDQSFFGKAQRERIDAETGQKATEVMPEAGVLLLSICHKELIIQAISHYKSNILGKFPLPLSASFPEIIRWALPACGRNSKAGPPSLQSR